MNWYLYVPTRTSKGFYQERSMIDVAVIGAGPAGSTCARQLALRGHDVLLIDRETFPRDKPCGGGFAPSVIKDFPYLKDRQSDFLEAVCRIGVLHSPNRRIRLESEVEMAVSRRINFDNVLLHGAIDAGASIKEGEFVREVAIRKNDVRVDLSTDEEVIAKAVVGADGINSIVARSTGLHSRWPSSSITPCRVVEVPMAKDEIDAVYSNDKKYHFFANFNGLPGYGWIFPKSNTVNVGIGIIGPHAKGLPDLFRKFIRFLSNKSYLPSNPDLSNAKGALVPTGGTIERTFTDRCILVGDSAGMVNPLTGGGIGYAMRAGKIGAKVLSSCLEEGLLTSKSLRRYEQLWRMDFGHEIGPLKLAQRIFTSALTPVLFEIGERDRTLQNMVASMMSEATEQNPEISELVARAFYVCLREAFHLK